MLLYGSFTLFNPPLLDDADSVHAEVAREMLVRHDYVTLYANGIRYLEKAPLLYWSMAGSYKLFGVSDSAARFPLAVYTLLLVLAVFVFGRRLFADATAGFYASLILLTSFGVFIFTRILIPDAMVCLWTTVAVAFFWFSLREGLRRSGPSLVTALGFAAACALNVLTKGLIGVVFPVAIVLVFLVVTKNLRQLKRWHPVAGFCFFLLIAAPWHILAGLHNPTEGFPAGFFHPGTPTVGNVHGFFWFYFINEHVLRYLNQRHSPGLRHGATAVVLGTFAGLAYALVRLPIQGRRQRALAASCTTPVADPTAAGAYAAGHLGTGAADLFQLFNAAGILRSAVAPATGAVDRCMAGAG